MCEIGLAGKYKKKEKIGSKDLKKKEVKKDRKNDR
jgi:hypothetical protein